MLRSSFSLLVSAVLFAACGPINMALPDTEDDYPEVAATAEASGLEVYWLGPSFEAGTKTFDEISSDFPEGFAGVNARGLQLRYLSIREDTEETYTIQATVDVRTFHAQEWPAIEEAIRKPSRGVRRSWETISIAGATGSLVRKNLDGLENGWLLILPRGESVILATASASIGSDGTEGNPLMDRDVFLKVMQNLRPYPE